MAVGPPVLGYMFSPSQVTLRKTCSGGLVVWQEIADLKVTGSNPVPSLFFLVMALPSQGRLSFFQHRL